jgi:hypothetical protein
VVAPVTSKRYKSEICVYHRLVRTVACLNLQIEEGTADVELHVRERERERERNQVVSLRAMPMVEYTLQV